MQGEMSPIRTACLFLLVLGTGWLLAGPACAEKEAISDQDLDRVSAAGICGVGAYACDGSDESVAAHVSAGAQDSRTMQVNVAERYFLAIGLGAQQGSQALILNNAVGTNQIANGLNISGGGAR